MQMEIRLRLNMFSKRQGVAGNLRATPSHVDDELELPWSYAARLFVGLRLKHKSVSLMQHAAQSASAHRSRFNVTLNWSIVSAFTSLVIPAFVLT